jgi:hypothetical protein
MTQFIIKTFISLALIISVSEISKRSILIGGILISLPIVSLLAVLWLWLETKDKMKVAQLSTSVIWLVIPSLVLFVTFPPLIRKMALGWALLLASALTVIAYYLLVLVLGYFHVKL